MSSGRSGRGLWYGVAAYALWGVFPVYFKTIGFVPADQIVAHRIIWSFVLLAALRAATIGGREPLALTPYVTATYSAAALLIAANWFLYVWGVTHGFIVETSLGYFITPLVQVLIGVTVLGERLRRFQWAAVGLAATGVGYLALVYGDVPWIALGLATSFGTYSLVKKRAPLGALAGLTLETGVLFLPAVLFLALTEQRGAGAFLGLGPAAMLLVAASGPITTLPLVLFAAAVRRMRLSALGILQFFSPTLQFLLGILVYREPFSRHQLVGFVFVWAAVAVFAAEGLIVRARQRTPATLFPDP
jgi:chloramphenicol-sensitive protein RarD